MNFALVWSYVAEHVDIQRINRHAAEHLDAAVMRGDLHDTAAE